METGSEPNPGESITDYARRLLRELDECKRLLAAVVTQVDEIHTGGTYRVVIRPETLARFGDGPRRLSVLVAPDTGHVLIRVTPGS